MRGRRPGPLNVFELGLVRSWQVGDHGDVRIVISPTAPSCILVGSIRQGIEQRVGAVAGVRSVEVDVETFWTPELMNPEGRTKLDHRRSGSMARVPVRPRQWESRDRSVAAEHPCDRTAPLVS